MPQPVRTTAPLPRLGRTARLLAAAGLLAAAVAGCGPKRVMNGTAVTGPPVATPPSPQPAPPVRAELPAPTPRPGVSRPDQPDVSDRPDQLDLPDQPDLPPPLPRGPSGAVVPERTPESLSLGAEAAELAREQVGKPYQWGAAGPDAFDCSGLVQHVFGLLGIDLPRISRDQATVGQVVRQSELQAGDLVFFSIDGGDVDHVGIYVGDGEFIHAPRRYVPVSIESLDNGWWHRHFRLARRIR